MFGLTRTATLGLGVALLLAVLGAIAVDHLDSAFGDGLGLAAVIAGVLVAALTDVRVEKS